MALTAVFQIRVTPEYRENMRKLAHLRGQTLTEMLLEFADVAMQVQRAAGTLTLRRERTSIVIGTKAPTT